MNNNLTFKEFMALQGINVDDNYSTATEKATIKLAYSIWLYKDAQLATLGKSINTFKEQLEDIDLTANQLGTFKESES